MTAFLFALWLALDVQGTSTCPTPDEVSQHVARLLPETQSSERASRAILSAGDGFVGIQLLGPEGGVLAERQLDRSGSCADMAEAVAVILAAWQAQFSPTISPTVIEPAVPSPSPSGTGPLPEVAPPQPFLFDAGLGALTSIAGGEAALGGKLEGTLTPFAHGLGFHIATSMSASHEQATTASDVQAQWLRPALSVGPNLRLQGSRLALDIHGDAVLALLRIKGSGSGLKENASDTTVQAGLAVGVRGLWTWNRAAAWLGADLLGFPGQDNLTIGIDRTGQLPHLEIQVALGISLGRFR